MQSKKTLKLAKTHAAISIVTPGLNEENNLPNCIDAILNQTILPAEVIFVNHNSTDNTLQVANSYKSKFKKANIKYTVLTEKKKGIANARNAGWVIATQPIIASLDSDCISNKDWIKNIDSFFRNNDIVACAGKIEYHDSPKFIKIAAKNGYYCLFYKILKFINGFHSLSTGNCAIQKDAFMKCNGFNSNIISINGLDDMELASRLSKIGNIIYNKNAVVSTSFRRYKNFKKAYTSLYERQIAWYHIRKNSKNLNK